MIDRKAIPPSTAFVARQDMAYLLSRSVEGPENIGAAHEIIVALIRANVISGPAAAALMQGIDARMISDKPSDVSPSANGSAREAREWILQLMLSAQTGNEDPSMAKDSIRARKIIARLLQAGVISPETSKTMIRKVDESL